jgi:hypothetical protein
MVLAIPGPPIALAIAKSPLVSTPALGGTISTPQKRQSSPIRSLS